ncbi:MAG: ComEC/Rec2 family competence protein, partial [Chitinophagales bacterium]
QSYTAAGVVHVLAVSGLHVAIVFALLHQLLFFLNRKKHGKLIQAIIILAAIWIFTMVTGLSGSVVRASTMFSFITIGKNMKRPVNLFNILACSAMVILLIDPLLVMDVGFQLSYLAVLGIGTLNNYIDRWLPRENKMVDYLWKMVAMSLAAQIATLPLTTYYFHQFPAYFLFANIVVIPIAGILLYLGITLIALQFISPLASLLGKAINLITYLMNEFIEHIQKLPAASIHLPEISLLQLLLFGAVIILISRFFITGAKKLFFAGMICTLLFITFHCVNVCQLLQQKTFTVYDFRKAGVLEFRSGNSAELYKCAGIISTQDSAYLEQHWRLSNIVPIVNADQKKDFKKKLHPQFSNCCSFVQFYNYRLAIVNSPFQVQPKTKKIKVNALLISGNPSLHLKDVLPYFETAHIIFDTSNSPYHVNKWKEEASQLGFAIHDVATEGAFVQHI